MNSVEYIDETGILHEIFFFYRLDFFSFLREYCLFSNGD